MKRFLIGLGVALLVLAGAALLLPSFIDWNRYRQQVADFLAVATGRTVEIAGPVDLSVLPQPTLTVGDVTFAVAEEVAGADGAQAANGAQAEVRSVHLRLRPLALLRGVVQIESLSLVEPRMRLDLLADGTLRGPVALAALGGAVQVDRMSIEDGALTLRDIARDRVLTVDRIRGEVDAGGPEGPYNVAGGFFLDGLPMSLDLTTGRVTRGGALPVRATLDLPDGDSVLRYAGVVTGGPAPMAQGELRAEGKRLAGLAEAVAALTGWAPLAPGTPALDQPFDLRGTLSAERTTAALEGVEIALGGSKGGGSLEIRRSGADPTTTVRLVLSLASLDLDALTVPADAPRTEFTLPAHLDLSLDLLADQAGWRGGVVRDVRLLAALDDGAVALTGLNAVLPGNAALALAGTITPVKGRPQGDLRVEITADSLRDTLDWLGLDVAAVPVERLRQARLTGRLVGRPRDFQLLDAAGALDTTSFSGALSVARMGRLGIGLKLEADRLDLDAYGLGPAARGWPARLRDFDANLDARIGQLTAGGVPVDGLVLSGTLGAGTLTLRELAVDSAAGVKARLSGRIGGLDPLGDSHLSVTAEAATLAPLFRALAVDPPVAPERLGPVTLAGRMAGDASRVALEAEAGFRGGTLQVGGAVSRPAEAPSLDLKLRGTFPDTADLVRLFAPDWRPATGAAKPFDVYAELRGTPSAPAFQAIQGSVAGTTLRGEASLDRGGDRPVIAATLQADALDLDRLLPALATSDGEGWSLGWTRAAETRLTLSADTLTLAGETLRDASLTAAASGGELDIEALEGRWREGELSASAELAPVDPGPGVAPDAAPVMRGTLDLTVTGAVWPDQAAGLGGLSLAGGRVDLALSGRGGGASPQELAAGLTGTLDVTAADGALTGVDLDRLDTALAAARSVADARAALAGAVGAGRTPLTKLAGRFALDGGALRTDDLRAETPAGSLAAKGTLDRAADTLDLTLRIDPARPAGAPGFTVALTGPAAKPDRAFAADALLDWVRARATPPKPEPPKPEPAKPAPAKPAPQKPETPPPAGSDAVKGILDRLKQ